MNVPRRGLFRPRFSPEGRRVAFTSRAGIGVFNLARETFDVITTDRSSAPVWHPDGDRLAFTGIRGNLLSVSADGSGAVVPLTTSDAESVSLRRVDTPTSWSRNGTLAFVRRQDPQSAANRDIWMLSLGNGPATARPLVATSADERMAEFSPDGHYLAYVSNQSGQDEVYVRPFPGAGPRSTVSNNGGSQPAWDPSGRELFYLASGRNGTIRMMAVDVIPGSTFELGKSRVLFEKPIGQFPQGGPTAARVYDVTPTGKQFVVIHEPDQNPQLPTDRIELVQNWVEELKRLVPSK